jgi:hypothetical protein
MIRSSGSFLPGPANRIEEDPAAADGRAPWLNDGWIGRDEQRLSRIAAIFAAAAAPECHVFLAFLSAGCVKGQPAADERRALGGVQADNTQSEGRPDTLAACVMLRIGRGWAKSKG